MIDIISNAKRFAKISIVNSGIPQFLRHNSAPAITVLRYHSIQVDPKLNHDVIDSDIVHPLDVFAEQMEFVARKYIPVSMDEVSLFLEGKKPIPKNAIAVTFDDGFADNYEVANPVLKRFGIPATFYVTVSSIASRALPWFCYIRYAFIKTSKRKWYDSETGIERNIETLCDNLAVFRIVANRCAALSNIEQKKYVKKIELDLDVSPFSGPDLILSWEQIRKLNNDGHIIGSHTMTHPNVAYLDNSDQKWELDESKLILENKLGVLCNHFSYPHPTLHPHWSEQTVALTAAAGYKTATTTTLGVVREGDNPFIIKRVFVPKIGFEFKFLLETVSLKNRIK